MPGPRTARAAKTTTKKSTADKAKTKAKEQAERQLPQLAKEVNARVEKAEKYEDQADNHRLAAALQLKNAKEACKAAGIKFADWCEENITLAYNTARQLARAGEADDPAQAIADMRAGGAKRVAAHREKQKRVTKQRAAVEVDGEPEVVAATALEQLGEDEIVKVTKSALGNHGLSVVAEADALAASSRAKMSALDRAKFEFDELSASDKMRLIAHAASATGVGVTYLGKNIGTVVAELGEGKKKRGSKRSR